MWNDFVICCGTSSGADETCSSFCVNDFLFACYYELSVVSQPYRVQDLCKFKIVEKWGAESDWLNGFSGFVTLWLWL
jgi:hypothetical protein